MSVEANKTGIPVLSEDDINLVPTQGLFGEGVGDDAARIQNLENKIAEIIGWARAHQYRYGERFVGEMLEGLKLFGISFGTTQPPNSEGNVGDIFLDYTQDGDAVRAVVQNGAGFTENVNAIDAALAPLLNRIQTLEGESNDLTTIEAEIDALQTLIALYSQTTTFASIAFSGDAGDLGSGILDPARIPNSVRGRPVVASGDLTTLTLEQQSNIGEGSAVLLNDGLLLFYSGVGSKTDLASYKPGPDATPDLSQVAGLQDALNAKQNKLAGTEGQIVGFNANGDAVPTSPSGQSAFSKSEKEALTLAASADVDRLHQSGLGGGTWSRTTEDISGAVAADTFGANYNKFFGTDGSSGGYVRDQWRDERTALISHWGIEPGNDTLDVGAAINLANTFLADTAVSNGSGNIILPPGVLWSDEPIVLLPGMGLLGQGGAYSEFRLTPVPGYYPLAPAGTIINSRHALGPQVRIKGARCEVKGMELARAGDRVGAKIITGTDLGWGPTYEGTFIDTFTDAGVTRDDQNYGIWIEGEDGELGNTQQFVIDDVSIRQSVNSSIMVSGGSWMGKIDRLYCGGSSVHDIVMDRGAYTGRALADQNSPGQIEILRSQLMFAAGNPILIDPTDSEIAYRVVCRNVDTFGAGNHEAAQESPYAFAITGEDVIIENCAIQTLHANHAANAHGLIGLFGCDDVHLRANRYLTAGDHTGNTIRPIFADANCRGVHVDGGVFYREDTGGSVPYFFSASQGAQDCVVRGLGEDGDGASKWSFLVNPVVSHERKETIQINANTFEQYKAAAQTGILEVFVTNLSDATAYGFGYAKLFYDLTAAPNITILQTDNSFVLPTGAVTDDISAGAGTTFGRITVNIDTATDRIGFHNRFLESSSIPNIRLKIMESS